METRYYVGIDAGSVSVNSVVIDNKKSVVWEAPYIRHLGRVEDVVSGLLEEIFQKFGANAIESISFTGNHGKKLADQTGAFYEFDTIAQVLGALYVCPSVKSIISMGGQDTALFQIRHHEGGGWDLEYFNTNGPCASGTGSFIDQQAERLATSMYRGDVELSAHRIEHILKDFIQLGMKSSRPSNVACRCTVFTKSDMIHLQNKGERLEDIIYGLHVGNARSYISTIVGTRELLDPILFIGGMSKNELQVKAFREYFPNLIVPQFNTSIGALGVALQALDIEQKCTFDPKTIKRAAGEIKISAPTAPRLALKKTKFPESNQVKRSMLKKGMKAYLGIDIGSTTTKYALINEKREIIHKCYIPTQGKPIEVTQKLLKHIRDEVGDMVEIIGTATTGSGRNVVGDFLNVDLIIDEITAHARGAVEIDAQVDTIFEIGGQDSKYIYIVNTYPLDFDMNKVCAAGTGSFLHELANKYGINIVGEFQEIALSSEKPVKLAERCTVFMESDLVSYLQQGVSKTDLIAGLCYAIVHNYLNRVVGKRPVGRRVMFLGGPSLNKGVVAAFENVLGRELIVPKHREVLGAFGAAVSVQEHMRAEGKTKSSFRGLESAINDKMDYKEKVCKVDPNCHNQCKLKIYDFDGRRSIWGGECGRYEITQSRSGRKPNYFKFRTEVWEKFMEGVYLQLRQAPILEVDGRPTVGMQRSLFGYQTSVLWAHFFDRLGYRLILTPPTNTHITKVGIEMMVAETCFPVKVAHGHIKELLGKTRYLFLPSLINMPTVDKRETGFYCPMVQGIGYMARGPLGIDHTNLLSPVVHLKYDPDTLSVEIYEQMGKKLGVSKKAVREALYYALEQHHAFYRELREKGQEVLSSTPDYEPIVIVTGRPYNLYDERLNLRLAQNLAKIGITALPMDFVDASNVDLSDFPNMYWGLGAQILRTARYVSQRQRLFGLHLTNFSCGPDSFIEHFYKHIMGQKAYLILELDEHSAVAGVMTRLEAFKNVIDNTMEKIRPSQRLTLEVAN